MSASWNDDSPLRFRGTPSEMSAMLREEDELPRKVPVKLALNAEEAWKAAEPHVARAIRAQGELTMMMSLPRRTPPGTYEGTVEVDGEERPVVIEVEPEVELDIVPGQLTLEVAPGENVPVDVQISNLGNVAVELRKAYALGSFAVGGLERSLHRAYTEKRAEGESRIDFLAERMAEEYGGITRVAVEEGAGEIEPGETRDVRFNFHVPSDLKSGRTYSGTLPIHDLRYYVRLVVSGSKTPPVELR